MFVDTNVIIDIVSDDPSWFGWSSRQLEAAALGDRLIVNDVVFAEISARYETVELVSELFDGMGLEVEPIPRSGLFLAGHAYRKYRQRGGPRTGVLADFFIGAHATVTGQPPLTRDPARYRRRRRWR